MNYPLLSDFSRKISDNYGVLIPDAGIALRGLFIIDPTVSITYGDSYLSGSIYLFIFKNLILDHLLILFSFNIGMFEANVNQ